MSSIRVLDNYTANRIAAGEVVERPASVVKELLENAIDAGATSITVETRGGGLEYIRISDNGSGIAIEEAATAFLPHATSKISTIDDLFSINTLGFRGEALPSIAAVARVTLRTKQKQSENGCLIRIEGGDILENHEAGVPDGTTIEVTDLFYNVPARLKFVKSPRSEAAAISDYVARMIMCRPDIEIKLIQGGKTVYHSQGLGELDMSIATVYGKDVLANIKEVYYEDGYLSVIGYIGTEQLGRATRTAQSFFINLRYVHSKKLSYALQRAYDTRLMSGRFPFAVLHITIKPQEVDVNVHPNKLEVRFRQEDRIFAPFVSCCRAALNKTIDNTAFAARPKDDNIAEYTDGYKFNAAIDDAVATAEQANDKPAESSTKSFFVQSTEIPKLELSALDPSCFLQKPEQNAFALHDSLGAAQIAPDISVWQQDMTEPDCKPFPTKPMQPLQQKVDFDDYEIIGQLFGCYWVIQSDNEVIFIDQHAAHERRLYERIIEKGQCADSQQLLSPEIIALLPTDFALFIENIELFTQLGFDIEEFGENTVSVRAVPLIMAGSPVKRFLEDAIDLLHTKSKLTTLDMKRNALITRACKSAVKAGQRLSDIELRALLDQYKAEGVPLTCPHGRPVMTRMTKEEFEKLFKRIV